MENLNTCTDDIIAFDWRIKDFINITSEDMKYFLAHINDNDISFKTMSINEFLYSLEYVEFDVITNSNGHLIAIGGISSNCEHFINRPKTFTLWFAVTEDINKYLKTLTVACYNILLNKLNNEDTVYANIETVEGSQLYLDKMLNMKDKIQLVRTNVYGLGKDILTKIKKYKIKRYDIL